MSAHHISQLPDDILQEILHGSGRLDDPADRAAARLVCQTWRCVIDRAMQGSLQPASVPCAAVAAAFSAVRQIDLCRMHRKSDDEVAAQLQQLALVLPGVTSLQLGGLWLRNHAGLRAVAQMPGLADLSLAGCRSDQVLQQLTALAPLASTLTHLDLMDLHRWEGRPTDDNRGIPAVVTQLTRLHTLVLGAEMTPDLAMLSPLAGSLQNLEAHNLGSFGTPLTALMALTSLTALTIKAWTYTLQHQDWAAVGSLSGLRRLALITEKDAITQPMYLYADAGLSAALKPLATLTALAVDGRAAGGLVQNLSRLTHLSSLRSLAMQHARVQVLSLPVGTQLQQLTRLDLAGLMLQSGSHAAVKQICELTALRCLQLGHSNILCSVLGECRMISTSLIQLRALAIADCPFVGHMGLRHLAALPALQQLDMAGTLNGLPIECQMPHLTGLDISGPVTTTEGAPPASCCPNLRELRLNGWRTGRRNGAHTVAAMLAGLSRLSQLSALHMENMQALGAHACSALLAKVAAAPALRFVNLNGSAGESGWLVPLHSVKTLRVLRCRGTYHINTALFAAHPYLRVFDSEYDTWAPSPFLFQEREKQVDHQ